MHILAVYVVPLITGVENNGPVITCYWLVAGVAWVDSDVGNWGSRVNWDVICIGIK